MLGLVAIIAASAAAAATLRSGPTTEAFRGWTSTGRSDSAKQMDLVLGLQLQNVDALEQALYAVSTPGNPRYLKHMSQQEVQAMTAPSSEAVVAVDSWIKSNNLTGSVVSDAHLLREGFVRLSVTVEQAENLLNCKYMTYVDSDGHEVQRVDESGYSVSDAIDRFVPVIEPTVRFPAPRRGPLLKSSPVVNGGITPAGVRTAYGITGAGAHGKSTKNRVAIASFLGQFWTQADLEKFWTELSPDSAGNNPTVLGPNSGQVGIEASLDIQYVTGIGSGVPTDAWSTAGQQPHNPENEPFLVWLTNVAAQSDDRVAKAISVSYGDNEPGVNFDYATRVAQEFMKQGARGISIMFSSGDGGVAGGQPSPCAQGRFIPTFPAAIPYVTAVGGTDPSNVKAAGLSSGGFSDYWERPKYQVDAVKAYMASGVPMPDPTHYNSTGAGFPDVAAFAEDVIIVADGNQFPVSGTSCASPIFTGVVSLINDLRMQAGKGSLGWLNPTLYSAKGSFLTDITSGNNPGCNTNGFEAAKGWDPVTGWGVPNFQAMSKQLVSA